MVDGLVSGGRSRIDLRRGGGGQADLQAHHVLGCEALARPWTAGAGTQKLHTGTSVLNLHELSPDQFPDADAFLVVEHPLGGGCPQNREARNVLRGLRWSGESDGQTDVHERFSCRAERIGVGRVPEPDTPQDLICTAPRAGLTFPGSNPPRVRRRAPPTATGISGPAFSAGLPPDTRPGARARPC